MNLNRKQKAAFKQILIPILAVGVISIQHFSFPFYSTVSIKYKQKAQRRDVVALAHHLHGCQGCHSQTFL